MNEASNFLQSHVKIGILSDEDFSQFIKLAETLPVLSERQSVIELLLRTIRLSLNQIQLLADTEALRNNPSLQLTLKRYIRSQGYASACEDYKNRSKWVKIAEIFMLLPF